ncbi:MAG TPA: cyclic nucleotide-binding domain-containing protein [Rhizomicrobium sp.]|nr:cyclic nucleotide-binding domain-containing protein [Rhizomicrobium sp.]
MTQSDVREIFKPNFLGLFKSEENVVSVKEGEPLFRKGDAGSCMYVVLSGELKVGDGNKIYEQLGPGGLVGEMALIDRAPRAATVTALTDATLAAIDEKRFMFLTQQTPSFALNVMRILSQRLRKMDAMVGD